MAPIDRLDPNTSFKHWIASDLRFYREKKSLSLSQMGRIMESSRHTVSNIEHARDGWNMNKVQAKRLDEYLELNGHFQRLVRYARTGHNPDWFAEYTDHENRSREVREYGLSLVPGLLQTPEYARAVITASRMVDDVEAAIEWRLRRQEMLARSKPPLLWVLLDESVLHRPVGGPEVMRAQLAHLREAAESPHVTIRVVPLSAGAYGGLDGAFSGLTLDTGELAFVEAPGGGRLIQDSAEIRGFGVRWNLVGASALPWDSSRDLIAEAMERYS